MTNAKILNLPYPEADPETMSVRVSRADFKPAPTRFNTMDSEPGEKPHAR